MAKTDTQRAAHAFLLGHFLSGRPFTLQEFREATGWDKPGTFNTYLRKQYRGLIANVEGGSFRISYTARYRVTETFRKLTEWAQFRRHVTQVRTVLTEHERTKSKVLIYEFLMPLTHETQLRITLDTLFFKDTILAKLRNINSSQLENHFPRPAALSDDDYFEQIIDFIGDNFVGYSISHVDGRFRAVAIRSYDEVATLQECGRRYLIDETTAVTRFIFPYDDDDDLEAISFLFEELFVESMIEAASEEKQIWMLEIGPEQRVHIWEAEDGDEDEETFEEEK